MNTITSDVESVINAFNNEGWEQLQKGDSYQDYLNQLRNLEPNSQLFLQDFHISEVLVFPPGTELHEHELYKNGSFYFMDKVKSRPYFGLEVWLGLGNNKAVYTIFTHSTIQITKGVSSCSTGWLSVNQRLK